MLVCSWLLLYASKKGLFGSTHQIDPDTIKWKKSNKLTADLKMWVTDLHKFWGIFKQQTERKAKLSAWAEITMIQMVRSNPQTIKAQVCHEPQTVWKRQFCCLQSRKFS